MESDSFHGLLLMEKITFRKHLILVGEMRGKMVKPIQRLDHLVSNGDFIKVSVIPIYTTFLSEILVLTFQRLILGFGKCGMWKVKEQEQRGEAKRGSRYEGLLGC